jgi:hypothetical protein
LLLLVTVAGLLLGAAATGWFYLHRQRAQMAGLEGTWRAGANSRHTHQFSANGTVYSWYESLPMEPFMRWTRHGNTITIKTDRKWDFEGELEGDTIRGQMILLNEKGQIETRVDQVWRRE